MKGWEGMHQLPSVLLSSQFEVAPGLCPFWQSYIKISCYCSLWGLHSFVRERGVLLHFVSFAPWLFLAIDQPETQEKGKHCFMLAYTSRNDQWRVCMCARVAKREEMIRNCRLYESPLLIQGRVKSSTAEAHKIKISCFLFKYEVKWPACASLHVRWLNGDVYMASYIQ